MKCKFESTTSYGNQAFLRGQTYELSDKDAVALGFKKAEIKPVELKDMRLNDLKAKAIEVGHLAETVNVIKTKDNVITLIENPPVEEPIDDEETDPEAGEGEGEKDETNNGDN